jgi:hypothetical protein
MNNITANRADILRGELVAWEFNQKAIALYEQPGFQQEGRFEKQIAFEDGFEADIPMAWFNPGLRKTFNNEVLKVFLPASEKRLLRPQLLY